MPMALLLLGRLCPLRSGEIEIADWRTQVSCSCWTAGDMHANSSAQYVVVVVVVKVDIPCFLFDGILEMRSNGG
jgi:hypothetical protein